MTVGIVGLGLIGGSFALAMKALGHKILGFDASAKHVAEALELQLIYESASLKHMADRCQIIAVCVPVDHTVEVCTSLLNFEGEASVVELSSTKQVLAKALITHAHRKRLILAHPMAGTEYSGPSAAKSDLFTGKTMVLCDLAQTSDWRVGQLTEVLAQIPMRVVELESAEHDVHVAYVSHLSHVISYALSITVQNKEKDEDQIFNLAAGGFASTVRLAKSGAAMWAPIFSHNRTNILDVLGEYQRVLQDFSDALQQDDVVATHALITQANQIRKYFPNQL